jgi:hypothetical protein
MTANGKFTWTAPSGAVIVLPSARHLRAGVLRKIRNLEGLDAAFTLLESVLDEDTLAAVDALKVEEFNDLFQAWQDAAGTSLPESSGSST